MTLIESLLNLYRVDGQVRGLRRRLDSAQRHLAAQTRQASDLLQHRQELEARRRQLQATMGNLEVELKSIDERLEKLRNELNSSVTNRQYSAVLTELNSVKAARAGVEDRELQLMEQVDSIEAQLKELESKIAERTKIRDLAELELDGRRADVGQRLAELESEREATAAVVPGDALVIFEQLADRYDGEAVAPIEVIDRRHREYACGACNMHVPFDHIAMLTSRGESLVCCTSCNRILYMQEEVRASLAKR